MSYTIQNVERNHQIVGWRVAMDRTIDGAQFTVATLVTVDLHELPVPSYPTIHQILHVARVKIAAPVPPKPIKVKRIKSAKWTTAHDRCHDLAQRHCVDIDQVVNTIPDALESLTGEWESRELAKRTAREITKLTNRDIDRISDSDRDYSTIPHFDEHAQELAYSHPELNWNPSDDNSVRLWELLAEPLLRKPTRFADETITRACELVTRRERGEVEFAEWSDCETADEITPF